MIENQEEDEAASMIARGDTEVSLSRVGYCDFDMLIRSDDEYDGRNQRRRYEEPLSVSLRKQIMSIAESVRRE